MSVHKAISQHVNKQNKRITEFLALDQQREFYIDEAISNCIKGNPFSADKINEVTSRINILSKQGIVPARKLVTLQMIEDYANKIK
ncbi:YpbS family protein [Bacillus sp. FJAT-29790]|uniref:YpbS family protein n=1 Tax=Bacillus sp. FJAT-29790 TaxID=1895002 RepID=UPI001C24210B|nr:YpbS family protein [Bacillus sp. FJAT-29790]MBU8878393.1 YpbS family protein [Bacillus sp. FJAT-29790]